MIPPPTVHAAGPRGCPRGVSSAARSIGRGRQFEHPNFQGASGLREFRFETDRRAQAALAFIATFTVLEGRSPSLREIGIALNRTKTDAQRAVSRLIRYGKVERTGEPVKRAHRAPRIPVSKQHQAQPQP